MHARRSLLHVRPSVCSTVRMHVCMKVEEKRSYILDNAACRAREGRGEERSHYSFAGSTAAGSAVGSAYVVEGGGGSQRARSKQEAVDQRTRSFHLYYSRVSSSIHPTCNSSRDFPFLRRRGEKRMFRFGSFIFLIANKRYDDARTACLPSPSMFSQRSRILSNMQPRGGRKERTDFSFLYP